MVWKQLCTDFGDSEIASPVSHVLGPSAWDFGHCRALVSAA